MAPANSVGKRALPSKESSLFKELLNLYETRQLKKGQKTADQILKKFPDHGETLCMKGLIMTHMGKRDEGKELVKKGIRLDLTSHICWHVFGLIQKGEKNYEEALKSYTQALRFDKENINLLTDTANIQTHLRLYDALVDTRHIVLKIRPNLRRNWIAMAVAYHLNGNIEEAKKVLESYERTLKNVPDYDVEHSEVILYHITVLEALGEYSAALSMLDSNSKSRVIVDRTAVMEYRARLLSKMQSPEAEHAWRSLIDNNSDCRDYYIRFFEAKGISLASVSDENRDEVLAILKDLSFQLPRANAPRRLALDVATGDTFKELARSYIEQGIKRGVPSLFVDAKSLYSDPSKRCILEEIVSELQGKYTPTPEHTELASSLDEPPTTYIWCMYYAAQQHSYLGQYATALSVLEVAITHTPTLPELYTCKARVLKRAGDLFGSVQSIEEARRLDKQDRFLNTKSGKYHLRAGLVDEAVDVLYLFTKKDATSAAQDLEEMQSMLFLTEAADAYKRSDKLALALKKYLAIQKVYEDIWQDQYDFHAYSLRRFNIRVYLDLLRWEDELKSQPAYVKSVLGICNIYIQVHDNPSLTSNASSNSQLTEAEKKAQKKAKKAAAKSQEDSKKAANAKAKDDQDSLEPPAPKDEDPEGTKALAKPDPLEVAWRTLKPLVSDDQRNIRVWITVYDVSIRRQKFLQAAKALQHAKSLDPEDPELHIRLVDFRNRPIPNGDTLTGPAQIALTQANQSLMPMDLGMEAYNSQFLQRHAQSASARLACAKVAQKLHGPLHEMENIIFGTLEQEVIKDIQAALASLAFLEHVNSTRIEEFRIACKNHFQFSTVFNSQEELASLRAQCHFESTAEVLPEEESKKETVL